MPIKNPLHFSTDPQIPRLLSDFIRSQTHEDDEKTKKQAVYAVTTELSRTLTETDTAALTELEKVLPHGQAILNADIAEPEHATEIAIYTSWHQQQRGRFQLAKDAGRQALALAEKTYAPGHTNIAVCQSYLGLVLRDLGDLDGAKALLTDALASDQQTFGPGHPSIAESQSNLALVLQDLGDLDGAKALLTEALASDGSNPIKVPNVL